MPRSVGGVSSKAMVAWRQYEHLPPPTGPEDRSQPAPGQDGARQGSTLKTGSIPVMPNSSHIPTANLLPQHLHLPHPLCPSPTFGPSEEQLVGGIQAEHRLGVSLCHRDTLQRGCPGILGATHRVDDAPSQERENRYSAGVERHCAHGPRAWKNTSCLTPSIFHCPAVRRAPPPERGVSEPRSLWKPQESPHGSPCLPLPQQCRQGKGEAARWPLLSSPNLSFASTDPERFRTFSSLALRSILGQTVPSPA